MRLLHTSDWHIGVSHHGLDRTPDHDHVFTQIKSLAIDNKVDIILNTGDLFDTSYPSVEILKYGWKVLEEFASVAPVVIVCGNHDGAKLFQLMGMILKNRLPIHFMDLSTLSKREGSVLEFPTAEDEILKVAAVPFVKSASYISDYIKSDPARATVTYADEVGTLEHVVGEWLNRSYDPNRDVRVFAAHLLVEGAQVGGGEYPLYIERDFVTRPERIPPADYVAFGHIHKPQQIGRLENGRYAGSPIQLDFGERGDRKSVYVVSGKPGYSLTIKPCELDVGRRMVEVRGTLETLGAMREQYAGTIARVVVDLEGPVSELDRRVRDLLPETTVCRIIPHYPPVAGVAANESSGGRAEPTISEMFESYVSAHSGLGDREQLMRYFSEFLIQVQQGEESTLVELNEALA